jgi:lambda repressor-like predicted transcriptional regulator
MDQKEIRKRLIDLDLTVTGIARREGVTHQAIGQTIRGKTVSRRLRRAIARALGVPVGEIWPKNSAA